MHLKSSSANKRPNTPPYMPFQQHRKSKGKLWAVLVALAVFALVFMWNWRASAQFEKLLSAWDSTVHSIGVPQEGGRFFSNDDKSDSNDDNKSDSKAAKEEPQESRLIPRPKPPNNNNDSKFYSQLSALISRAKKGDPVVNSLHGTLEFSAKILSSPIQIDTEEKTERTYVPARLSRSKDSFLLDFGNFPGKHPEPDTIVSVSGKVATSVSWVANNNLWHYLVIHVEDFEVIEPGVEILEEAKIDIKTFNLHGTFEFKGAHFTEDTFKRKVVVIYFNLTNTGRDTIHHLRHWYEGLNMSLGNNEDPLNDTIHSLEEVDKKALRTLQTVKPGQTLYYFEPFLVRHSHENNKTIYFKRYDDNFNISAIALEVAASLSEMKH
jgi:hypothetical protein